MVVGQVSIVVGIGITSVDFVAVAILLSDIAVSVATAVGLSTCCLTTVATVASTVSGVGQRDDTTIATTTSVIAITEFFAVAVVPSAVVTSAIVWFALVA